MLAIRGAPALGVAGAMGIALAARDRRPSTRSACAQYLAEQGAVLAAARPTAVNLAWGVGEALAVLDARRGANAARGCAARIAAGRGGSTTTRWRAAGRMGAHGAALFAGRRRTW